MENAQSIIFQMQKVGKHMMEQPRKLCETQNVHEEKGDSIQPTPSLRGIISGIVEIYRNTTWGYHITGWWCQIPVMSMKTG
jgi:hypothetical protein